MPPQCMRVHVTEFTLARRYITPADAELLVNMDVALEGVDRVLLLGMRTCMWIAAHGTAWAWPVAVQPCRLEQT